MKCHFHKTCDGLHPVAINQIECQAMEIREYQKLIESQKNTLQTKVNAAINQAVDLIKSQESCLWKQIESNPKNEWKFDLETIKIQNSLDDSQEVKQQPRSNMRSTQLYKSALLYSNQRQERLGGGSNFNHDRFGNPYDTFSRPSSSVDNSNKNQKVAEYQLKLTIKTMQNANK